MSGPRVKIKGGLPNDYRYEGVWYFVGETVVPAPLAHAAGCVILGEANEANSGGDNQDVFEPGTAGWYRAELTRLGVRFAKNHGVEKLKALHEEATKTPETLEGENPNDEGSKEWFEFELNALGVEFADSDSLEDLQVLYETAQEEAAKKQG